jgi:phosphoribosylformylglycinamidine synthase
LPPELNLERVKRVQEATREIVASGLAESAHDLSDGGLAVALAECTFGPAGPNQFSMGARIDPDSPLGPALLLYHEAPSRVLISTAEPEKVATIATNHGIEALHLGVTIESELEIRSRGELLGRWPIADLKAAYEHALESHVR